MEQNYELLNKDLAYAGIYRVKLIEDGSDIRAYIPGISQINPFDASGNLIQDIVDKNKSAFPIIDWCAYNLESCDLANISEPMWCMFECGDVKRPVVLSYTFPKNIIMITVYVGGGIGDGNESGLPWSGDIDSETVNDFLNTDLKRLRWLTINEIQAIIDMNFKKKNSIFYGKNTRDIAVQIYKAQQESGLSANVPLSIGALESAYGTSNIAHKKNNLFGWGAVNENPMGGAYNFSSNIHDMFLNYSNSLMSTYYDGYGAKTLNQIGTGNNPERKGYAYNDNGSISTTWAPSVGSIGGKFLSQATENAYLYTDSNISK